MNKINKEGYINSITKFGSEVKLFQELVKWNIASIIEINSNIPWNITTIMAWVHGNELSWINALNEILKDIQVISWKVYFIFANLKALEIWERFFEKNMNRCFFEYWTQETFEEKRVQEIIPYLLQSDYLLDVHNTLNTENSIPFLISEHKELSKYFNVEKIISWLDILHPGWSDGFMNSVWKIWLCLESWSIYDEEWPEIAKSWILNFLKFTWNISWEPIVEKWQEFINLNFIYKNKTLDFKFTKKFLDFEKVPAWFIIWYDWWEEVKFSEDKIILFTHDVKNVWEECFCIGNVI